MLQFLGNEGKKSYRLKLERGSACGDLIVLDGRLIAANYGLLSGEDAICEFMTWEDGTFFVERLSPRLQAAIEKNMNLPLVQVNQFSDHASFLLENSISLNTVIRPSRLFGTAQWQESSKRQPLQREDFLILGWLSGGRTMRQSMREFSFDLVQCTAILYRLILTGSVEVVRADLSSELHSDEALPQEAGICQEILDQSSGKAMPPPYAGVTLPVASPPADTPVADAQAAAAISASEDKAAASCADNISLNQRTTVLPIISIDIERLMKATFTITEFGFLALKNTSLDEQIRKLLLKVEAAATIESVVETMSRSPVSVLSTYRYCLDRGYISNPDPVLQTTADLLLGRLELEQYLLQRRRVTGQELKDLRQAAHRAGISLMQMLVQKGFLTQEDLDNVNREQMRFAMH